MGLAECINGGDWNCLGGIYDQNWGMADGMHAVVFVDNHDNQRGHGGAGGDLTASNNVQGHDDWKYKIGAAFLLAHDYGFKRVMSSYYFDNTDQGPPGAQPAPFPNACGNGWTCEHRWSSIMNMVQFANVAVGEPVQNWQAGNNYLGFSRGSKAFVAMGNLGKDSTRACLTVNTVTSSTTVSRRFRSAEAGDISRRPRIMILWWPSVWDVNNLICDQKF